MLALAYVLQLEDLAREVHAHTVAAGIAAAFGTELPGRADFETAKAVFDETLAQPPAGQGPGDDSPDGIKLRALGVGR